MTGELPGAAGSFGAAPAASGASPGFDGRSTDQVPAAYAYVMIPESDVRSAVNDGPSPGEFLVRLSGEKTYSGAVQRALKDFVRRAKARRILDLQGSGAWEGDLAAMRGDQPRRRRRK